MGGLAAWPAALLPDAAGLAVLGLAAAVAGLAGFAAWLAFGLLARLAKRTQGGLDDELVRRLALPAALAVGAAACTLAVSAGSGRLDPALTAVIRQGLGIAFIGAAVWALVRVLRVLFEQAGKRRPRLQPATRLGGRLVSTALYAFLFLTVLSQLGLSITPLLTGLGIAALAVALALQDTLSNFFAGIWIQTGKALQPGHYVRLEGEKLEGYLENVGWRTTRVRTLSGSTISIPNARLAQAIVTDFNLPSPDLSVVMEFRVGYEADPAQVVKALVEEAKAAAQENKALVGEPFAQLASLEDDCLKFSLIVRVDEFVHQFQAQHDIRVRILQRFRKDGIRIPYPTRHNLQEPVSPPAKRNPRAPGGLAPSKRPPRPRSQGPEVQDPREVEAEQAKSDIAAQQRAEGKKP